MPLGIEVNAIAPNLIQNAGNDLSQIIRDTGKMVQGHIAELQTRRDMASMTQDLQGLNVQSNDFPLQMIQMASRHPLAIRDERGQMALNILGKAHNQWQNEQAAIERLGRPMNVPGVGLVDPRTNTVLQATPTKPVSVYGKGLVNPMTGETVAPEGTRTSPTSAGPRTLTPGSILVDPTGKQLATNPKPEPTLTPYQSAQLKRAEKKSAVDAIKTEVTQLDKDITSAVRQYEASFKREQEAEGEEKLRHQADKTEIGKIADQLKAKKQERIKALQELESKTDAASDAPESIREAYRSGILTREQAKEAILKLQGQ